MRRFAEVRGGLWCAGGTCNASIAAMKHPRRTLLALLLFVSLPFVAHAQRPTTIVQLLNASTSTGRTVVGFNDLIGAGAHYFTYCTTASSLQIIAEESPDNVSTHFVPISTVYGVPSAINGNACAVIQVGGMYGYPAVNVLSISGGSVSVWYSGTVGIVSAFPPATNSQGAATVTACDKSLNIGSGQNFTTELIAGTSTQSIHVCGFTISFSAATSTAAVYLQSGTGSTCATGSVIPWSMFTTASSPQTVDISRTFSILPSTNLCLVVTGVGASTNVEFNMSYALY
jgi:hypothetical protein